MADLLSNELEITASLTDPADIDSPAYGASAQGAAAYGGPAIAAESANIGKTLETTWAVSTAATRTLSTTWNIETAVGRDLRTRWHVGNPAILDLHRREVVRVKVEDSSGTMQDMSDVEGVDWLDSVEIDADVERMAMTADLSFHREVPDPNDSSGTISIAPLMSGSAANSGGALLAANRDFTVEAAIVLPGETPSEDDYQLLIEGRLDDAQWGGDGDVVTVPCRDLAGRLHDRWIEDAQEYGSDSSPVAIETVMQSILDDTLGSGEVTLVTEGDPDFVIVAYEQKRESLESALNAHRDLIGWDLRYRLRSGEFKLVFSEPDRDREGVDHEFSADDYFSIAELERSGSGVRNVVEVFFTSSSGEDGTPAKVEDPDSIAEFDRRYLMIDMRGDALLIGSSAANFMAEAALAEVSQPAVSHVAEQAFSPQIQLGDLVRYEANGVHYDTDQDLAVVGYTHRMTSEGSTTNVRARGAPTGGAMRWIRKARDTSRSGEDSPPPKPTMTVETAEVQTISGTFHGVFGVSVKNAGGVSAHLQYSARIGAEGEWSAWETAAQPPTPGQEYQAAVEIKGSQDSQARFRLTYTVQGQTDEIVETSPTFARPGVGGAMTIELARAFPLPNTGGSEIQINGNADTGSWLVAGAVDSEPSLATIRSGRLLNDRSGSITTNTSGGDIPLVPNGSTLHIGALPYSQTNAGGTEGEVVRVKLERGAVDASDGLVLPTGPDAGTEVE